MKNLKLDSIDDSNQECKFCRVICSVIIFFKKVRDYIYTPENSCLCCCKYKCDNDQKQGLTLLTKEEYIERLVKVDPKVAKNAFEKAWATRNFEIEIYWKRATYFWAFIGSTFAGYFALVSSDKYIYEVSPFKEEVYFLICIGFILSLAWHLTNIGSKSWQRHWEVHVDLLENAHTGPLYKTVNSEVTYSVSKINEIISLVFIFVWFFLGIKFFLKNKINLFIWKENWDSNLLITFISVLVLIITSSMFFGHGRGRFSYREVKMYRRNMDYKKISKN